MPHLTRREVQTCQKMLADLTYACGQGLLSLEQIDATLGKRLFAVVSEGKDRVSLEQLVIAKARCLKVSRHHKQLLPTTSIPLGRPCRTCC